jgi:dinuclear metal center YbgI/SA1388 family protein
MKLREVVNILEGIAPLELAEEWDNVGLLAGDLSQTVRKVMLTIDLTKEVLTEAQKEKVDLLLAYHPPIWEPLKRIVARQGTSPLLYEAIRSGMAVYALHTALDAARGGVNDVLAEIVGIAEAESLVKPTVQTGKMCKLVVFLPESDLEKVSEAIFTAGAGTIGENARYTKCSFRCGGVGTFQGSEESTPTVGEAGRFEQAPELRLETVAPVEKIGAIVKAMLKAHSYEEVAYDVIPLLDAQSDIGLGRCGDLPKPVTVAELIERIKKKLKVKTVGLIGPQRGKIKRAAVCAGSCGSILRNVIRAGCDFYLTGELKHHHALELQEAGVTTVCVSHSVSERIILPRVAKRLKSECHGVEVLISRKDRDPFTWQ